MAEEKKETRPVTANEPEKSHEHEIPKPKEHPWNTFKKKFAFNRNLDHKTSQHMNRKFGK
jgi:hypothetical protein